MAHDLGAAINGVVGGYVTGVPRGLGRGKGKIAEHEDRPSLSVRIAMVVDDAADTHCLRHIRRFQPPNPAGAGDAMRRRDSDFCCLRRIDAIAPQMRNGTAVDATQDDHIIRSANQSRGAGIRLGMAKQEFHVRMVFRPQYLNDFRQIGLGLLHGDDHAKRGNLVHHRLLTWRRMLRKVR